MCALAGVRQPAQTSPKAPSPRALRRGRDPIQQFEGLEIKLGRLEAGVWVRDGAGRTDNSQNSGPSLKCPAW